MWHHCPFPQASPISVQLSWSIRLADDHVLLWLKQSASILTWSWAQRREKDWDVKWIHKFWKCFRCFWSKFSSSKCDKPLETGSVWIPLHSACLTWYTVRAVQKTFKPVLPYPSLAKIVSNAQDIKLLSQIASTLTTKWLYLPEYKSTFFSKIGNSKVGGQLIIASAHRNAWNLLFLCA